MYGHGYDNTRFSPLKQINAGNVGKLKLAFRSSWLRCDPTSRRRIVIGDTMYVSTSWGPKYVYALDAAHRRAASGPTSRKFPTTCCSTPAAT